MKKRMRKLFVGVIVAAVLLGSGILVYRSCYNPYPKEGSLFHILEIDSNEIESIAVTYHYSVRAAEDTESIENLISMLNQNVSFVKRYNMSNIEGSPDWNVYFFLQTGEKQKIGIYDDMVIFTDGEIRYCYQGTFDLSVFEEVPMVENSTKYWREKENYTSR